MNIENDRVASIHYTLTNDAGETLDSSHGGDPLPYLHGKGNIIPGLEKALHGKAAGDELKVDIPPEDGYGEHRPELVQNVPKEAFQGVEEIQPGMQFQTPLHEPTGASQQGDQATHQRGRYLSERGARHAPLHDTGNCRRCLRG